MPSSGVTTPLLQVHAKSKTRFSSAKPRNYRLEMFTWYRTADRIALLFSIVIHVFNVQTINCMPILWTGCNWNSAQSRNEINTNTKQLLQKHNNFLKLKRSYLVFNEEKRKQGNKKEKLTESLLLTVKMAKRSNDILTLVFRNFAWTKSLRKPQSESSRRVGRFFI